MTDFSISLPESMRAFVDEQVTQGGFSTASDYVAIDPRRPERNGRPALGETLLVEGMRSGDSMPISDEWWERKKADLVSRLEPDKYS